MYLKSGFGDLVVRRTKSKSSKANPYLWVTLSPKKILCPCHLETHLTTNPKNSKSKHKTHFGKLDDTVWRYPLSLHSKPELRRLVNRVKPPSPSFYLLLSSLIARRLSTQNVLKTPEFSHLLSVSVSFIKSALFIFLEDTVSFEMVGFARVIDWKVVSVRFFVFKGGLRGYVRVYTYAYLYCRLCNIVCSC